MSGARRSIATIDPEGGGVGIVALHHVQLAMPQGGEAAARRFYAGVLGLREVPKPAVLLERGGLWFEANGVRVHLGVEGTFVPARKAHPALAVASLDSAVRHLDRRGVAWDHGNDLPGLRRIYVADPFENRIELAEQVS